MHRSAPPPAESTGESPAVRASSDAHGGPRRFLVQALLGLVLACWSLAGDCSYVLVDVGSPVLVVRAADSIPGVTPPILDFRCSAVRVDTYTVLTATHCVDGSIAIAHGGQNICGPRPWSRSPVAGVHPSSLDTTSLDVAGEEMEPRLVHRISADSLLAVGWQQPDRTRPLSCWPVWVELGGCQAADEGLTCRSGTVCSGFSGAGVYDSAGLVGVISASDGCVDGSTVLVSAVP